MTKKRRRLRFLSRQRPQLEALESRDLLAVNLVADVNQIGLNSSNPRELVQFEDQTYFVADSELGTELWRTDGTSAGTVIVRDIVEGPGSSHPTDLVEVNGLLFFEAQTAEGTAQVWRTDGTSSGTFSVGLGEIKAVTGRQVLFGSLSSPDFAGWITDGTVAGTESLGSNQRIIGTGLDYYVTQLGGTGGYGLVRENADVELLQAAALTSFDENAFLRDGLLASFITTPTGDADIRFATEVRFTDIETPQLTRSFSVPGTLSEEPELVVRSGDHLYFVTEVAQAIDIDSPIQFSDYTLWSMQVDGAMPPVAAGRFEGISRQQAIHELTVDENGDVWFVAGDELGVEIRRTDGTAEGTVIIADIAEGEASSNPHSLLHSGATLFFIADDGETGDQVWSYSPARGAIRMTSIPEANPFLLGTHLGVAYFSASSDAGVELWTTDGVSASLLDVHTGRSGSFPTSLLATSNATVLFAATTDVGRELWTIDASGEALLVRDIHAGQETQGSNPNNLAAFGDRLYFAANDGANGSELWSTDGLSAELVHDIAPGTASSNPQELVSAGDLLYFVADDGVHGRELWLSDGTAEGTRLAVDAFEGEYGSSPESLVAFGGAVYFTAIDRVNVFPITNPSLSTRALWTFDGQTATRLRTLSLEGRTLPEFRELTAAADGVYFYEIGTFDNQEKTIVQRINANGEIEIVQDNLDFRQRIYEITTAGDRVVYAADLDQGNRDEVWTLDEQGAPLSLSLAGAGTAATGPLLGTESNVFFRDRRGDTFASDLTNEAAVMIEELASLTEVLQTDQGYFFSSANETLGSRLQFAESLAGEYQTLFASGMNQLFPASQPRELTEFAGEVYFIADLVGDEQGTEVWKTDGTSIGTRAVTSFDSTLLASRPSSLTVVGEQLFFAANDGISGRELWVIDDLPAPGDIDDNGELTASDIDLLFAVVGQTPTVAAADLNNDDTVDRADADVLVRTLLQTEFGDANLDQRVNFADFLILSQSFGRPEASWAQGDFDGDGTVTFADFLILSSNFGFQL